MNNSTEGVTLYAVFLSNVMNPYKENPYLYPKLLKMVEEKNLDLSNPNNKIPISAYNEVCGWIEEKIGPYSAEKLGLKVGESVWEAMSKNASVSNDDSPLHILETLCKTVLSVVQDPLNRGYEILKASEGSILMRRTQTFNGRVQKGVIKHLASKSSKVKGVRVTMHKSIEEGDKYDEYLVTFKHN